MIDWLNMLALLSSSQERKTHQAPINAHTHYQYGPGEANWEVRQWHRPLRSSKHHQHHCCRAYTVPFSSPTACMLFIWHSDWIDSTQLNSRVSRRQARRLSVHCWGWTDQRLHDQFKLFGVHTTTTTAVAATSVSVALLWLAYIAVSILVCTVWT